MRLGLTQTALGRLIDVDPRTVRRWCAGDLPIPRAVMMLLRHMSRQEVADEMAGRR